ncbi:MAG TPA: AgmX/PglI C-terminal domain-containing protein [Myxococcota bacterium]|jgi:hypothetical protein|nr:AgmX/PglI C-terminal domain-containing protein [Myxococcota bacterium]
MNAAAKASEQFANTTTTTPMAPPPADGVEVIALWDGTVQSARWLEGARASFTIGEDAAADWSVTSGLPAARWPLVLAGGAGDVLVSFADHSEGEVQSGPDTRTLAELRRSGRAVPAPHGGWMVTLPAGARASVAFGQSSFVVTRTARPERLRGAAGRDWKPQLYNALSLLAHALVILLMVSAAPDAHSMTVDSFAPDSRYVKLIIKPVERPEDKVPAWLTAKKHDLFESGTASRAHKGPPGKAGTPDAARSTNRLAIKSAPGVDDMRLARVMADRAVTDSGILGLLKSRVGSPHASEWSRYDSAVGKDEMDALGHMIGDERGDADGSRGLSLYDGPGHGGTGTDPDAVIGLDDDGPRTIGSRGHDDGDGLDDGCAKKYGCTATRWDRHDAKAPDSVAVGAPKIIGTLSADIIRRVIRKHAAEIKYCYEKELLRAHDLAGKVKVLFVIDPSGAVRKSSIDPAGTSIDAPTLRSCVLSTVGRFIFPKPEGGGIVEVGYVYTFNAPAAVPAK